MTCEPASNSAPYQASFALYITMITALLAGGIALNLRMSTSLYEATS